MQRAPGVGHHRHHRHHRAFAALPQGTGRPALPTETAPTCTAGKQGALPPEEGGAEAGLQEGGASCGAGQGGAMAEGRAGRQHPWWFPLLRNGKTRELCHFLSVTDLFLFPASATESVLTAFILSDAISS